MPETEKPEGYQVVERVDGATVAIIGSAGTVAEFPAMDLEKAQQVLTGEVASLPPMSHPPHSRYEIEIKPIAAEDVSSTPQSSV